MSVYQAAELKYPFIEAAIDRVAEWWRKPARTPEPAPQKPAPHKWSSEELTALAHEMSMTKPELDIVLQAYPALAALMARRQELLAFKRLLERKLGPDEASLANMHMLTAASRH